jgi:hypothetical protein
MNDQPESDKMKRLVSQLIIALLLLLAVASNVVLTLINNASWVNRLLEGEMPILATINVALGALILMLFGKVCIAAIETVRQTNTITTNMEKTTFRVAIGVALIVVLLCTVIGMVLVSWVLNQWVILTLNPWNIVYLIGWNIGFGLIGFMVVLSVIFKRHIK